MAINGQIKIDQVIICQNCGQTNIGRIQLDNWCTAPSGKTPGTGHSPVFVTVIIPIP